MPATQGLFLSNGHNRWSIQFQQIDGGPSLGGDSHQHQAVPSKVFTPAVSSWMKQCDPFSRLNVHSPLTGPLPQGTRDTRQRQIGSNCGAAVRFRNNVVQMEGGFLAGLGEPAVFTPITRS